VSFYERRAFEQFLFAMAGLSAAAAAFFALYYLGFRDRSWSAIAPALVGLGAAATFPALIGLGLARRRNQHG
jgi:ABC-type Fe3+-siderophore transport system permease subunit